MNKRKFLQLKARAMIEVFEKNGSIVPTVTTQHDDRPITSFFTIFYEAFVPNNKPVKD